jgi:hypothetical protein
MIRGPRLASMASMPRIAPRHVERDRGSLGVPARVAHAGLSGEAVAAYGRDHAGDIGGAVARLPAWSIGSIALTPMERTVPVRTDGPATASAGAALVSGPRSRLAIGAANDPLEAEADAIADRVIARAGGPARATPGDVKVQRKCSECEEDKVRRKATGEAPRAGAPNSVRAALQSPGRPLDAATRSFMEPRFGHSFAEVRIHSGGAASAAATAIRARAFTLGRDVVFAQGEHRPETTAGRRLLAHELTHVVQQGGARAQGAPR